MTTTPAAGTSIEQMSFLILSPQKHFSIFHLARYLYEVDPRKGHVTLLCLQDNKHDEMHGFPLIFYHSTEHDPQKTYDYVYSFEDDNTPTDMKNKTLFKKWVHIRSDVRNALFGPFDIYSPSREKDVYWFLHRLNSILLLNRFDQTQTDAYWKETEASWRVIKEQQPTVNVLYIDDFLHALMAPRKKEEEESSSSFSECAPTLATVTLESLESLFYDIYLEQIIPQFPICEGRNKAFFIQRRAASLDASRSTIDHWRNTCVWTFIHDVHTISEP